MDPSRDHSHEEMPQDLGLALGIDFGNSQISAAVWSPDKKKADMVKFDDKSSFKSTLYFSELAERKDGENESNIEQESLNPEIGVDFTFDKKLEFFVYDIKNILDQNYLRKKLRN